MFKPTAHLLFCCLLHDNKFSVDFLLESMLQNVPHYSCRHSQTVPQFRLLVASQSGQHLFKITVNICATYTLQLNVQSYFYLSHKCSSQTPHQAVLHTDVYETLLSRQNYPQLRSRCKRTVNNSFTKAFLSIIRNCAYLFIYLFEIKNQMGGACSTYG